MHLEKDFEVGILYEGETLGADSLLQELPMDEVGVFHSLETGEGFVFVCMKAQAVGAHCLSLTLGFVACRVGEWASRRCRYGPYRCRRPVADLSRGREWFGKCVPV
jgi:hypothetical protein